MVRDLNALTAGSPIRVANVARRSGARSGRVAAISAAISASVWDAIPQAPPAPILIMRDDEPDNSRLSRLAVPDDGPHRAILASVQAVRPRPRCRRCAWTPTAG
jgi:hypothetical protein